MDMNKLKHFCVLYKTGSLTRASELLSISQPALSKSIKVFENEIGKKLILPEGRGITITDYGRALALHSMPLLDKLHHFDYLTPMENKVLRIATFEVDTQFKPTHKEGCYTDHHNCYGESIGVFAFTDPIVMETHEPLFRPRIAVAKCSATLQPPFGNIATYQNGGEK